MNQWSNEEIRLTRFAWAMKDADEYLARRARAAHVRDIVVAWCMGVACVAVFVLSQW